MKLKSCIHKFIDEYLLRLKGSEDNTIEGYKYAFTFLLPYAADYYSIKIESLTIDHLTTDLVINFLEYLEKKRLNKAQSRNCRLAAIKAFAKMLRLMYPEHKEIANRIIKFLKKMLTNH